MAERTVYDLNPTTTITIGDFLEFGQVDGIERKGTVGAFFEAFPIYLKGIPATFDKSNLKTIIYPADVNTLGVAFSDLTGSPLEVVLQPTSAGVSEPDVYLEGIPLDTPFYIDFTLTKLPGQYPEFASLLIPDNSGRNGVIGLYTNLNGTTAILEKLKGWFIVTRNLSASQLPPNAYPDDRYLLLLKLS